MRKLMSASLSFILVFSLSFPATALAGTGTALQSAQVPSLQGSDADAGDGASAADEFGFVYVGAKELAQDGLQDIVVAFADESRSADGAVLVLQHGITGEQKRVEATQIAQYALVFSFEGADFAKGQWGIRQVEYTVAGQSTAMDIAASHDASFTVIGAAAQEGEVETAFYAVEDDEVVQADSLDDAVQKARESADAPQSRARSVEARATNLVIGLDPGHGGDDGGASAANGTREADLTWKIASYCKEELQRYHGIAKVVMSREQNEYTNDNNGGLKLRVDRLKAAGANVIVSIHLNASGVGGTGAEVYAPNSSGNQTIHQQGTALAAKIAAQLKALGIELRSSDGVKYRDGDDGSDYYGIIRHAKEVGLPGIIVEHCFIDSSDYAKFLNSEAKLKNLGVADATGIAKHYNLAKWYWDPKITIGTPSKGKVKVTIAGAGAPSGLKEVQVPVWCETNGQNDLVWYQAKKQSNGDWAVTVDISKHKEGGNYIVHVYAKVGTADSVAVGSSSFVLNAPTSTLNAPVVNTKAGTLTYTAHVKSPNGTPTINLAVWCSTDGKDDLVNYNMARTAGTATEGDYSVTVSMAKHDYQVGTYNAQLTVKDPMTLQASTKSRTQKMSLPSVDFKVTPVSGGKSYRITGSGGLLAKASSVEFPVWSNAGGRDDLRWYKAKKVKAGTWQVTVPLKKHKSAGTYTVHCYAKVSGKERTIGQTSFKVTGPSVSLGTPKVNKAKGTVTFSATVKAPLGIASVQLPVWCSSVKGQDDIRWYKMKRVSGNSKQAKYSITVKMANHKYQAGTYTAHAYVKDSVGIQATVKVKKQKMSLPPATVKAAAVSGGKYYRITASGGVMAKASAVSFPVWSNAGGQDDLRWYKAKKVKSGTWQVTVPIKNHKSSGTYTAHCYATVKGHQSAAGVGSFKVTGPTITALAPKVNAAKGTVTFSARVKSSLGVSKVTMPAWCSGIGGKDDLRTYTMKRTSGTAKNGVYSVTVSMAKHKYQTGTYSAQAKAKDTRGVVSSKTMKQSMGLPASTVRAVASADGQSYTLTASGGFISKATEVHFPTWSDAGGQDDLVWYRAKKLSNGSWQATVPLSAHRTAGAYTVHCYATIGGAQSGVGGTSFTVSQATIDNLGYPIMGATSVSRARMVAHYKAWLSRNGKSYPSSVYTKKGAPTIEKFIEILCAQAAKEGVKAEVVYAQAMHETGYLQFGGDVKADQCNFAGLGATGGVPGNVFKDVAEGLLAQVQHLKAYASTAPLNEPCVDQRFSYVTRGCATTVEALGGKWAVGTGYGERLRAIISEL